MPTDEAWTEESIAAMPAWTLVQTYHAVARRFAAAFGEAGLGATQFGVLVTLTADPAISQGELARRNLVSPQNITALLTSLQERGLIDRPPAVGRGRRRSVRLTPAGHDAVTRVGPAIRAINAPEALGLSDGEAAELNRLLRVVQQAVGHSAPSRAAAPDDRPR